MTFCRLVLIPVILVLRQFVEVVREVVRTVCEWVRGLVRTLKEITERVCSWLPWPINELCKLVTRVIEVIEEVWNWVCREVLDRIVEFIERVVEYVIYVLKWVCWVVAWPVRLVELLLCRLGVRPRLRMHLCIRVLTEPDGTPAATWAKVRRDFRRASEIFEQCNIELVLMSAERIERPDYVRDMSCDVASMFTRAWTWFAAHECVGCAAVTVYYVDDIVARIGCSWPGSDWVLVDDQGNGATIAHEIGHLADLWAHSDDPANLMHASSDGTALTAAQCCMIRSSRYAIGESRCPGTTEVQLPDVDVAGGELEHSEPASPAATAEPPSRLCCPGFRSWHASGTAQAQAQVSGLFAAAAAASVAVAAARRIARRAR